MGGRSLGRGEVEIGGRGEEGGGGCWVEVGSRADLR